MASIGAHQVLNWLSNLFGRRSGKQAETKLYKAVMRQALEPELYRNGLAVDTFDGRFEAVALHATLAMRALRQHGAAGRELADTLYREVFSGFDHALRERGAGDSSIARKIRGYGERFFGLARAVDAALDGVAPFNELQDVLLRNGVNDQAYRELSDYLLAIDADFAQAELESFELGQLAWPRI